MVAARLLVLVGLAACSDTEPERFEASDIETLVDHLDCSDTTEIDSLVFPIRGGAATRGVMCQLDDGAVHVFDRAPLGDPSAATYAAQEGGSLENIDRSLNVGVVSPGCDIAVFVGERIFIVGTPGSIEDVTADLDGAVRPSAPASPTVSYLGADCDLADQLSV